MMHARSATLMLLQGFALLVLMANLACGGKSKGPNAPLPVTSTSFAVFSDPHLHDAASLGSSGAEWEAALAGDRKMWKESAEILDSALADLKTKPLDFVLVAGDLTKDGEYLNHQSFAAKLASLRAVGKKVFVVPGNHDVLNPDGRDYRTTPATKARPTTPAEFKQIYGEYGYNAAIATDPASLSYVAEPVTGLWVLALDSCSYSDTNTASVTAGALRPATLDWALARLQEAKAKGKVVIGLQHHGLVEHFLGQAAQFPEYLLAERDKVGKALADNGMNLVFTGHYHANDVALKDFGTSKLHDIETGSLVTAPCPYRTITLDLPTRTAAITSSTVKATANHPMDFVPYSSKFLSDGLTLIVKDMLVRGYRLDNATAEQLTPVIVPAMMAHYAGDEAITNVPEPARSQMNATLAALRSSPDPQTKALGESIFSLWNDPAPADNALTVRLN